MKYLNQVRKYGNKLALAAGGSLLPVFAFATPGPYDAITDAVDFAAVAVAVVAIAALIAAPKVAMKAGRMILGMIR